MHDFVKRGPRHPPQPAMDHWGSTLRKVKNVWTLRGRKWLVPTISGKGRSADRHSRLCRKAMSPLPKRGFVLGRIQDSVAVAFCRWHHPPVVATALTNAKVLGKGGDIAASFIHSTRFGVTPGKMTEATAQRS
jgi:hypothetical protein